MQKVTIETVREYTKINQPTWELMSTEYINNCTDLIFYCTTHKREFPMTFTSLKKGSGCPRCGNYRFTIEDVSDYIENNTIDLALISTVYINANSNLLFHCKIHNFDFPMSFNSIKNQHHTCPICALERGAKKRKFTIEEVNDYVIKNCPTIKLLSKEYVDVSSKLSFYCTIHKEVFEMSLDKLKNSKQGCKTCAIDRVSGQGHHNWKGGITPLHNYLRSKISPWRIDSSKKYNYRCDITGTYSNDMVVHHLYNFSDILQETVQELKLPIYDTINKYTKLELKQLEATCLKLHYKHGLGVCLSEEEHVLFHSIYGVKNNTKEQYTQFKQDRQFLEPDIPLSY